MKNRIFTIFLLIISVSFNLMSQAQTLQEIGKSNLPLVVIDVSGAEIPDEPKIKGKMGIIWNGEGELNSGSDAFNDYNGNIAIEKRGSSSQQFPKKSYGFELQDELGEGINESLLAMPKEEDWILYAPYSDKTLIRNVLTFTLGASLGHYSPRCRFVELFIDNEYQGVYVLMEKVKRDKNRVDVAKLTTDEVADEDITGGYIIKIDKTTGSGGEGWHSDYYNYYNSGKTYYQYEYPKQENINQVQKEYIQQYVQLFEKSLREKNFDAANGFLELANDKSFIDYFIMTELSKNVDGYRLSTFLYKDKNERLNIGPLWDYNLAYGNANYYNGAAHRGHQYLADLGGDANQVPFWWRVLLENDGFKSKVKSRWDELRANHFSDQRIEFVTDSLVVLLAQAQTRNFNKWPVIGQHVWPNAYVGHSYMSEVNWMKNWLSSRINWLDGEINDFPVSVETPFATNVVSAYPNPFTNKISFTINPTINGNLTVYIYNTLGVNILQKEIDGSQNTVSGAVLASLPSGIYMVKVEYRDQIILSKKLIK